MNVIELHKKDLLAGHKALKAQTPQTDAWWEIKGRISKYEISFGQAANMANEKTCAHLKIGLVTTFENAHLEFYQHLTAPYRPEKKLKEGVSNIDDEITLEQTNDR